MTPTEVRAPAGVLDVQPADMTVTVGAGTSCAELAAALRPSGRSAHSIPATRPPPSAARSRRDCRAGAGSAPGPLRETLLEVVLVRADGRVVRGGGPTVKNVTGYDVPRLVVGSLGTLGVLVQVTLRAQPIPSASAWFGSDRAPADLLDALYAPAAITTAPTGTRVWLQGHPDDLVAQAARGGLTPRSRPPIRPARIVDASAWRRVP